MGSVRFMEEHPDMRLAKEGEYGAEGGGCLEMFSLGGFSRDEWEKSGFFPLIKPPFIGKWRTISGFVSRGFSVVASGGGPWGIWQLQAHYARLRRRRQTGKIWRRNRGLQSDSCPTSRNPGSGGCFSAELLFETLSELGPFALAPENSFAKKR